MRKSILTTSFFLMASIFIFTGCVRVPGEPDDTDDPNLNPWELVEEYVPEDEILNTYAVKDVLFVATNNEFIEIDKDNKVRGRRSFKPGAIQHGTPAFSDNTFVRLTNDAGGRQSIEFHLTKNDDFISYSASDLSQVPGEIVEVEFNAKELGAYNYDGTKFIIPTTTKPNFHYTFFVFQIRLDGSTFNFREVSLQQRIDIPEIPADFDEISSIQFFDGYWYVGTKVGGFKIDKDGNYSRFSNSWIRDFFRRGGKLYATAFGEFDLLISEDNGVTWDNTPTGTGLQWVTLAGQNLVSQTARGQEFQVPESLTNIFELKNMRLNSNLQDQKGLYYSFSFFNENYYLAVGKDLYFAPEIFIEE